MTTRKVKNPNEKGGSGFIWAIVAIIAIALLVLAFIVFNGRSNQQAAVEENMFDTTGITATWSEDEEVIHLASEESPEAPAADLYEDFSCSYCGDLEVETGGEMIDALKAGDIQVELRPMVLLDQANVGHSTRSLSAMLAMFAHGDVNAALNYRDYMFSNQQDVYNRMELEDLAELAQSLGASDAAVQDIRDGSYIETAQNMSAANQQRQAEIDPDGQVWTPRVAIDGETIPQEQRNEWVSVTANS